MRQVEKKREYMLFCEKEDVSLKRSLRLSKIFNMDTSISSYFVDRNEGEIEHKLGEMRTSLEYASWTQSPSNDISVGIINLIQTTIPKVEYMGTDFRC